MRARRNPKGWTEKNPVYFLGTTINGQRYQYTALGLFQTALAAVERCREHGALVFEQWECWRTVNFGLTEPTVVAVCVTIRDKE